MYRTMTSIKIIDKLIEKIGSVLCYALVVLMLIQMMEVILRYVFNSPTIWAWDVNRQIFVGVAILSGSYALLHNTHVRIDVISKKWGPRTNTVIESVTYSLLILALCFVIWKGVEMVAWSWQTKEHVHSYFAPILWPVKICLPLGAFLMLLQTISKLGRLYITFRTQARK